MCDKFKSFFSCQEEKKSNSRRMCEKLVEEWIDADETDTVLD